MKERPTEKGGREWEMDSNPEMREEKEVTEKRQTDGCFRKQGG